MQAIYNKDDCVILQVAHEFRYGIYDEPGVEKYAGYDENGNFLGIYFLGGTCFEPGTIEGNIPEDIVEKQGKYIYDNGQVVPNPDWHEYIPEPSPEEKIATLQEEIDELKELMELQSEALDYLIMNNM